VNTAQTHTYKFECATELMAQDQLQISYGAPEGHIWKGSLSLFRSFISSFHVGSYSWSRVLTSLELMTTRALDESHEMVMMIDSNIMNTGQQSENRNAISLRSGD
jgi:hypothetical protein